MMNIDPEELYYALTNEQANIACASDELYDALRILVAAVENVGEHMSKALGPLFKDLTMGGELELARIALRHAKHGPVIETETD